MAILDNFDSARKEAAPDPGAYQSNRSVADLHTDFKFLDFDVAQAEIRAQRFGTTTHDEEYTRTFFLFNELELGKARP